MITEKRSKAIQELIKELVRVENMGSPEWKDFDGGWGVLICENTARELMEIYSEHIRCIEELVQLKQQVKELSKNLFQ
jgi:hypothetical protein